FEYQAALAAYNENITKLDEEYEEKLAEVRRPEPDTRPALLQSTQKLIGWEIETHRAKIKSYLEGRCRHARKCILESARYNLWVASIIAYFCTLYLKPQASGVAGGVVF